ncbi:MAG: hypothetical protein MI757_08040 [Pirellulales bacterium]|nr:hypothetical protein [Pirellulales bacterium]
MGDPHTLETLVCPDTRGQLSMVPDTMISRINSLVAREQVVTRSGTTVTEPLSGGLLREDGELLYPIVDGIPKMIADEAIPMEQLKDHV